MSIKRIVRVNELLKREIADELVRLLDRSDLNPATIMVSHVETSPNLKHAAVGISVFGDDDYKSRCLKKVRKMGPALQRYINKVSSLKFTPQLQFELDESIAEGDHVLGIIAKIEHEHPEWNSDAREEDDGYEH